MPAGSTTERQRHFGDESRGAHSRIDYPSLDTTWGTKNNVIVCEGSAMKLRQLPVPELPGDLKQLLADEK